MNIKYAKYDLDGRLISFSVRIIHIAEKLPKTITGKHLAGQLIRSGTSPTLNYGEAQSAESTADFIHKMKLCLKELRETMANLKIIQGLKYFKDGMMDQLIDENDELIAIFVASLKTAQHKHN